MLLKSNVLKSKNYCTIIERCNQKKVYTLGFQKPQVCTCCTFSLQSLEIANVTLEIRMLGLMKTMVENPVMNKVTVLAQIGDAENVATVKMKQLMEKRREEFTEDEKPLQSNNQFQNRVKRSVLTNFYFCQV